MPDQLFTDYVEYPLVIISINVGVWEGIMVINQEIEIWVIGKGGSKRWSRKRVG
jgi:hypothetical protein